LASHAKDTCNCRGLDSERSRDPLADFKIEPPLRRGLGGDGGGPAATPRPMLLPLPRAEAQEPGRGRARGREAGPPGDPRLPPCSLEGEGAVTHARRNPSFHCVLVSSRSIIGEGLRATYSGILKGKTSEATRRKHATPTSPSGPSVAETAADGSRRPGEAGRSGAVEVLDSSAPTRGLGGLRTGEATLAKLLLLRQMLPCMPVKAAWPPATTAACRRSLIASASPP